MTLDVIVTTVLGSLGPDAADRVLAAEVARVTGILPEEVGLTRTCRHCGGDTHGRPVVTGPAAPFVGVSRAEGVLMVAVSLDCPVGVDVERVGAGGFPGFADVARHPQETAAGPRDCSTLWVRKEALLKATGHGLQVDPRQIRISDGPRDPRLLAWPLEPMPAVQLLDLELDEYVACVAVLSEQTQRLTLRRADAATLAG